jgi:hypothetical protein
MKQVFTSSRSGGAAAVLVLAIFLIIGGLFVGKSIVDTKTLEAEAATTELETLQKRVQTPVRPAAQSADAKNAFLEGSNLALAANSLQQRITALVDASGGTLATIGIDPPDADDDAAGRRVVVQASCEFDNDGLQKFIYQLESTRPLVLIDTLDVRQKAESTAQSSDNQNSPRLTVNIRAIGYYRGAAK